jgi:nucleoid-associated protein YgaU
VNAGLTVHHTPASLETPTPPIDDGSSGRPVYASVVAPTDSVTDADPGYRIHVIHDGDTLERLAKRYLNDGSRALELFDLNRDVLDNPNLLEIGVELRIPIADSALRK